MSDQKKLSGRRTWLIVVVTVAACSLWNRLFDYVWERSEQGAVLLFGGLVVVALLVHSGLTWSRKRARGATIVR